MLMLSFLSSVYVLTVLAIAILFLGSLRSSTRLASVQKTIKTQKLNKGVTNGLITYSPTTKSRHP
jgi:hypothetical protein